LGAHAKFQNPTINPSGRKVTSAERGGEKNAVNSGHLTVCTAPLRQKYKDMVVMIVWDSQHVFDD
jgi:hypothetical protein